MNGKQIAGVIVLVMAAVLFVAGALLLARGDGPALRDPSMLGVSRAVGSLLPSLLATIAGLWLLKRPKPLVRPKASRRRTGRSRDDREEPSDSAAILLIGGLLLLVCGLAAVTAVAVWKSKPSDTAQQRVDEEKEQGAEPQAVTPKGPDNPNSAAPKPPDRFPPAPEEGARLDPLVSGLVGQWTNQPEGLTAVWTIRSTAGKWEVSGLFFDGEKEVGSFVGLDVQMSGQTLTFVTKYVRQPPRAWLSGANVTAKLDGGKLTFTWHLGGSSGTQTMTRVER